MQQKPTAALFSFKSHHLKKFILTALLITMMPLSALAQRNQRPPTNSETYSSTEIIDAGHQFFGTLSRGLALTVQEATKRWGQPNGYILGQEASGAFFAGLRFGEGQVFTRNGTEKRIYWQGPSLGFDVGGDGDRTMIRIYNLPSTDSLYTRFVGIDGSAYLVGGFGMTAVMYDNIVVVPIRTGIGARLGVNLNYIKFTPEATWNPF